MTIIKIEPFENGAHANQTGGISTVPDGWALLPETVGTPATLEAFPFGEITVETVDGVATVSSWTPGTIPEPEPEPDNEPTAAELLDILLGVTE